MAGLNYYVIDTETTGLSVDMHELVEISIIRCADKVQISRNVKAEHPMTASFDALQITNKTIQDLYHGISKEQMIEEIDSFFASDGLTSGHRCIICHNTSFDRRFLHNTWEKCNKYFQADLWLDTIHISKQVAKKKQIIKPKLNLDAACELFGIKKVAGQHTAKSDSRNTYLLWKKFVDDNEDFLSLIKRSPHQVIEEIDEDMNDLLKELDS